VSTLLVVIYLDVLKYRRLYLPLAMPPLQNIQFSFEGLEKTLPTGVVPAVPLPAHALPDAGAPPRQRLPELTTRSTADSLNALVYSLRSPMITPPWVYHGLNHLPTVLGEVQYHGSPGFARKKLVHPSSLLRFAHKTV
jgi:hypothetical protein